MRKIAALVTALLALLFSGAASAQLYAATGSNGVPGVLYNVNPATGASSAIGPIVVGALPVSITGLAISPTTGVLYGAVANGSPNFGANLVTINPGSGAAAVVGPFGGAVSDISFNSAGTLFAWHNNTNRLATVNLATGAITDLGASGLAAFAGGGGLAIDSTGQGFVSVSLTTGTIDRVNTTTGAGTVGPAITGSPIAAGALNAMAFSPAGVLFAVDSNRSGSPTTNFLVTVNTTTGAITSIGALPGDTDAIVFAAPAGNVPTLSEWALILLAVMLVTVGMTSLRGRA